MRIYYNLEDFAVSEMFRPFSPTIDIRCWEAEFAKCFERRIECRKVKDDYEKAIRKDIMKIVEILENNGEAKEEVFKRLKMGKWKFYKHLKHPLIDYVNLNLLESEDKQ